MTLPAQILTSDAVTEYRTSINGLSAYVPPLWSNLDQVFFRPATGLTPSGNVAADGTTNDTFQSAALMFLDHSITSATRIRWKYNQNGTTALTGNYALGIYNSAGTKIIDTGSVAFTGTNNTVQNRSETISATSFDQGPYYVWFGFDPTNSTGISFPGVSLAIVQGTSGATGPPYPNLAGRVTSGGVTAPANLSAFTDVQTLTTGTVVLPVPLISLSVG